jgi:hypothetical protein
VTKTTFKLSLNPNLKADAMKALQEKLKTAKVIPVSDKPKRPSES